MLCCETLYFSELKIKGWLVNSVGELNISVSFHERVFELDGDV